MLDLYQDYQHRLRSPVIRLTYEKSGGFALCFFLRLPLSEDAGVLPAMMSTSKSHAVEAELMR